jgi:regulator of sigma E protease
MRLECVLAGKADYRMSHILSYLSIVAGVVLLFGAAIFVHEFGHFWVALKRGLKVEEFSIGFGPKIISRVRDGILYSVRWIPAGGYVKLPQMVTSTAIEGDSKKEPLPPAPAFSKILVAAAGPAMNVVFAFVIAAVIYFIGLPVPFNPAIIGYVDPESPEAKMGIQEGDRIVELDHKPATTWEEVNKMTILALTNVLPVTILHTNGLSNTYFLKAEVNNLVNLKALNLDARDHLIVGDVTTNRPAALAGVRPQDEVVGFAGVPISSHVQLIDLIQIRGGQKTPIVVKRGNQRLTFEVKPVMYPKSTNYVIGVAWAPIKDVYRVEFPTPLAQVKNVCQNLYGTVRALVHSRQSGVGAKDLSGPVGIFSMLAVEWHTDYRLALSFLVMLNINLAILNMLPIPVLDGGHILMALIERCARRPLSVRFVESVTTAFAVVLITFFLYVTAYDIKRVSIFRLMFKRDVQIEQGAKPADAASQPQPVP